MPNAIFVNKCVTVKVAQDMETRNRTMRAIDDVILAVDIAEKVVDYINSVDDIDEITAHKHQQARLISPMSFESDEHRLFRAAIQEFDGVAVVIHSSQDDQTNEERVYVDVTCGTKDRFVIMIPEHLAQYDHINVHTAFVHTKDMKSAYKVQLDLTDADANTKFKSKLLTLGYNTTPLDILLDEYYEGDKEQAVEWIKSEVRALCCPNLNYYKEAEEDSSFSDLALRIMHEEPWSLTACDLLSLLYMTHNGFNSTIKTVVSDQYDENGLISYRFQQQHLSITTDRNLYTTLSVFLNCSYEEIERIVCLNAANKVVSPRMYSYGSISPAPAYIRPADSSNEALKITLPLPEDDEILKDVCCNIAYDFASKNFFMHSIPVSDSAQPFVTLTISGMKNIAHLRNDEKTMLILEMVVDQILHEYINHYADSDGGFYYNLQPDGHIAIMSNDSWYMTHRAPALCMNEKLIRLVEVGAINGHKHLKLTVDDNGTIVSVNQYAPGAFGGGVDNIPVLHNEVEKMLL